jgi:hypothetical protein
MKSKEANMAMTQEQVFETVEALQAVAAELGLRPTYQARERHDGLSLWVTIPCRGGIVLETLTSSVPSHDEARKVLKRMASEAKARNKGTALRLRVERDLNRS